MSALGILAIIGLVILFITSLVLVVQLLNEKDLNKTYSDKNNKLQKDLKEEKEMKELMEKIPIKTTFNKQFKHSLTKIPTNEPNKSCFKLTVTRDTDPKFKEYQNLFFLNLYNVTKEENMLQITPIENKIELKIEIEKTQSSQKFKITPMKNYPISILKSRNGQTCQLEYFGDINILENGELTICNNKAPSTEVLITDAQNQGILPGIINNNTAIDLNKIYNQAVQQYNQNNNH